MRIMQQIGWLLPAGQFLKPVTVDKTALLLSMTFALRFVRFTFLHPINIRPA
jgi:hypothetical protein